MATGIEEITRYCQKPLTPVEAANHLELPAVTTHKKYRHDNQAAVSRGVRRSSRKHIANAGA
jgi:hypothetical protein